MTGTVSVRLQARGMHDEGEGGKVGKVGKPSLLLELPKQNFDKTILQCFGSVSGIRGLLDPDSDSCSGGLLFTTFRSFKGLNLMKKIL